MPAHWTHHVQAGLTPLPHATCTVPRAPCTVIIMTCSAVHGDAQQRLTIVRLATVVLGATSVPTSGNAELSQSRMLT